ncbi:MAG TPA: hypothetical protein DIW43_09995 [Spongiibacteraceae bacterium]|nr:hypothetical protein [Spongiibacteraceae bacterium]HCS27776.1 hypothetical protein [Spongiibacteraceae bacterium]
MEPGSKTVSLTVPESVLERLIASGALCVSELCCQSMTDKQRVTAICKRCCARSIVRSPPA